MSLIIISHGASCAVIYVSWPVTVTYPVSGLAFGGAFIGQLWVHLGSSGQIFPLAGPFCFTVLR